MDESLATGGDGECVGVSAAPAGCRRTRLLGRCTWAWKGVVCAGHAVGEASEREGRRKRRLSLAHSGELMQPGGLVPGAPCWGLFSCGLVHPLKGAPHLALGDCRAAAGRGAALLAQACQLAGAVSAGCLYA